MPLYQNRGYGNRMVIAKRMRRRRREVGGIGCICEAEKESVVHGLSQRAETVPEWLEVFKDIFGSRNLWVRFFVAIYPAEYRITVQCLHDTQVKYTMDEKCLKAQKFLSPQRKDENCLGNLVDHPSFSLTLTKLFATVSTSSSTNLLAFLFKKKIQDFHLNTLFHLLS